jgi:Bacterial Ig-like domain (group 2)
MLATGLLQVNPAFAGIDEGTTTTLTASLNGTAVRVTWESSDVTVATVSAGGVATAVAPGHGSVTATETVMLRRCARPASPCSLHRNSSRRGYLVHFRGGLGSLRGATLTATVTR